jgi:hypothetical protein
LNQVILSIQQPTFVLKFWLLTVVPLPGNETAMVQTRNNQTDDSGATPDPVATQLAAIAAKLESMETLKDDIALLKTQAYNRDKSGAGGNRFEDGTTIIPTLHQN